MKKLLNLKNTKEECINNTDYSLDIPYDSSYLRDYKKLQTIIDKKIVCGIVDGIVGYVSNSGVDTGICTMLHPYNDKGNVFMPVTVGVIPMQCEPSLIQLSVDFTVIDVDDIKTKSDPSLNCMTVMFFEVTEENEIIKGLGTMSLPLSICRELFTFRYDCLMKVDVIKHMHLTVSEKNYIDNNKNMVSYSDSGLNFKDISSIVKCGNKSIGYIAINNFKYDPLLTIDMSPLNNAEIENIKNYVNIINIDASSIEEGICMIDVIIKKHYTNRYLDIKYIALVTVDEEGNIEFIRNSIRKLPSYAGVCHYCLEDK